MGRVAPPLVWEEDQHGERAGPYTIRNQAPHRWQLLAGGRTVGMYPTRSAARLGAAQVQRRSGRRRRLIRHLGVACASLVAMLLALAVRTEPNPEYPPARAIADRFDEARLAVEEGEATIDQIAGAFAGLSGAEFEHGGRQKLGLAGVFDGECYGLVWRAGFEPGGVVIRTNYLTCAPDPSLIEQPDPDPPGLLAQVMVPSWDDALPDEERSPVWFLPLFIVAFGLLFGASVRATVLLLPARR